MRQRIGNDSGLRLGEYLRVLRGLALQARFEQARPVQRERALEDQREQRERDRDEGRNAPHHGYTLATFR